MQKIYVWVSCLRNQFETRHFYNSLSSDIHIIDQPPHATSSPKHNQNQYRKPKATKKKQKSLTIHKIHSRSITSKVTDLHQIIDKSTLTSLSPRGHGSLQR